MCPAFASIMRGEGITVSREIHEPMAGTDESLQVRRRKRKGRSGRAQRGPRPAALSRGRPGDRRERDGKTTNALEAVVRARAAGRRAAEMVHALGGAFGRADRGCAGGRGRPAQLDVSFDALEAILRQRPSPNADQDYDPIVSLGELWSTVIVSAHCDHVGPKTRWIDARRWSAPTRCTAARGSTGPPAERGLLLLEECARQSRADVTQGFIGAARRPDHYARP